MKIRKALKKDLKNILKLNLLLFKREYKKHDKLLNLNWTFGKMGMEYFKNKITKKNSCLFIAIEDERIMGYLAGGETKGEDYRILPKMAEIEDMFILKKYQRTGVGTKLYQTFFDWCKKRKVKIIKVESYAKNKQAIDFYRKNKFKDYALILEYKL